MDLNMWYVRQDSILIPRTPEDGNLTYVTNYRVREGDTSNPPNDFSFNGLAELVAVRVFEEGVDSVRLFRATKPIGDEKELFPYLTATKKSVEVRGATSQQDALYEVGKQIAELIYKSITTK
jgi:hypothetical protein